MADKKLNEVTKVTDLAYVPVIMSDGSIGQIAKADLASVVAEQIRLYMQPNSAIRAKSSANFDSSTPNTIGYHVRFDDNNPRGVGYELFFAYAGGLWYKTEQGAGWKQVATK